MVILKASNAESAGVIGVVFMRDQSQATDAPPTSRVFGKCLKTVPGGLHSFPSWSDLFHFPGENGGTVTIPVLGVSYQIGEQLQKLIEMDGQVS